MQYNIQSSLPATNCSLRANKTAAGDAAVRPSQDLSGRARMMTGQKGASGERTLIFSVPPIRPAKMAVVVCEERHYYLRSKGMLQSNPGMADMPDFSLCSTDG